MMINAMGKAMKGTRMGMFMREIFSLGKHMEKENTTGRMSMRCMKVNGPEV